MKTGKILFVIFIFLSSIKEGFIAFKQTGDIWYLIIFPAIGIIVSGLLFRSAFKPKEKVLRENKYNNYLWNFLKIISIFGLLGLVFNPGDGRMKSDKNSVEHNGVKISLSNCLKEMRKEIEDVESRKEFCNCFAETMANNELIMANYKDYLRKGQFSSIVKAIQTTNETELPDFEDCAKFIDANQ